MENTEKQSVRKKFFSIVLILLLIIFVVVLIINSIPKDVDKILIDNDYEFEDMYKIDLGEETIASSKNVYSYKKGNVSVLVYEYDNFDEIKNEIFGIYEPFKGNRDYDIIFEDKDNYIYMRSCDIIICDYYLGYESELVSTSVVLENKEETDKVFNQILKDKKLS